MQVLRYDVTGAPGEKPIYVRIGFYVLAANGREVPDHELASHVRPMAVHARGIKYGIHLINDHGSDRAFGRTGIYKGIYYGKWGRKQPGGYGTTWFYYAIERTAAELANAVSCSGKAAPNDRHQSY